MRLYGAYHQLELPSFGPFPPRLGELATLDTRLSQEVKE
jgi:hypothetical protein